MAHRKAEMKTAATTEPQKVTAGVLHIDDKFIN
jgi:hypothetical protein